MYITDIDGKQIKVTNLEVAIKQTDGYRQMRHEDPLFREVDRFLQKYWHNLYVQLMQLKHPGKLLFHFQLRTANHKAGWEEIRVVGKAFKNRDAAVALAKRAAARFQCEVRLTAENPFRESGAYFR